MLFSEIVQKHNYLSVNDIIRGIVLCQDEIITHKFNLHLIGHKVNVNFTEEEVEKILEAFDDNNRRSATKYQKQLDNSKG